MRKENWHMVRIHAVENSRNNVLGPPYHNASTFAVIKNSQNIVVVFMHHKTLWYNACFKRQINEQYVCLLKFLTLKILLDC